MHNLEFMFLVISTLYFLDGEKITEKKAISLLGRAMRGKKSPPLIKNTGEKFFLHFSKLGDGGFYFNDM